MFKRIYNILLFSILIPINCIGMEAEETNISTLNSAKEIIGDAEFPKGFLWGTAVAEWQNSGSVNCGESNWSEFENKTYKGQPTIKQGQKSGIACDSWNNMKRDVAYMKEIGVNSYRFSLSWEAIEPIQGEYSQEAIDHYHELLDLLEEAGIVPMITLHHFVHPKWFQDLGAFEKRENIPLFTQFAEKMFKEFSDKVKLWCVINEANVSGFQGYINGAFPPGKVRDFLGAVNILRNLMEAHTETYLALKNLPNGPECQIGFVHQYLKFEPYYQINLLDNAIAKGLSTCFANESVIEFLKTGEFSPLGCIPSPWDYKAPTDGRVADFVGLNFYSRVMIRNCSPTHGDNEIMTDMPYPLCSDKFYDAIKDIATIGLPIYITENGIADKLDNKRGIYFKEYLSALCKAIREGYVIRGFYYWTLIDNFEWDEGFKMRFGLVEYNTETGETRLRDSVELFTNVIKLSQSSEF